MGQNSTNVLFVQANDYLERLDEATLGAVEVAGMYATGSIALGDFQPATSDVDVMVVTQRSTSRPNLNDLIDAIAAIPIPVRGLEYVAYPLDAVAHPEETPRWELNLNLGPRLAAPHVGFDPTAEPRYWFILDIALARQSAISLHGPPAAKLIGPIPDRWIADALAEGISWHAKHEPSSANRVLSLCRAWRWTADQTLTSKGAAAAWADARLPDPVIGAAADIRATGSRRLNPEDVERFAARIEPEIERALAAIR